MLTRTDNMTLTQTDAGTPVGGIARRRCCRERGARHGRLCHAFRRTITMLLLAKSISPGLTPVLR